MDCNKTDCIHRKVCEEWKSLGNDNYINESNGNCDCYNATTNDLISRSALIKWIDDSVSQFGGTYSTDMLNMWGLFKDYLINSAPSYKYEEGTSKIEFKNICIYPTDNENIYVFPTDKEEDNEVN